MAAVFQRSGFEEQADESDLRLVGGDGFCEHGAEWVQAE
jgi:hypothetical protein